MPAVCPGSDPCFIEAFPTTNTSKWAGLLESVLGEPPLPGLYQIWKTLPANQTSSPNETKWVLLREGTEIVRIVPQLWDSLCTEHGLSSQSACKNPVPSHIANTELSEFGERFLPILLKQGRWQPGLDFSVGTSANAIPGMAPEFERRFDVNWLQAVHPQVWVGVGSHWGHYGGGLTRYYRGRDFDENQDWWSNHWWWSATVAVPALRYRIQYAQRPHPELFWLQPPPKPRPTPSPDDFVRIVYITGEPQAAFGHAFFLRTGMLGYSFYNEQRADYKPVHQVEIRQLPLGQGSWAMGLFLASGRWVPFLRAELLPLGMSVPFPGEDNVNLKGTTLRVDFHYLSRGQLHAGLSLSMALDHPWLHKPIGGLDGR